MSKRKVRKTSVIEKRVMDEVKSGQIKMLPKIYFILGSVFTAIGIISTTIAAVFLTNLTFFLINKKGPGYTRLTILMQSLPLWVPALAVAGVFLGIVFLRKYDISYKKNFPVFAVLFITSIIIAGMFLNYLGLNDIWSHKGPLRGLYRNVELQTNRPVNNIFPKRFMNRRK